MDRINIIGGKPLHGVIPISGAKNAALPLMIASLMTGESLELMNVPRLADIHALLRILGNHGVDHMVVGKRPGDTTETGQTIRLTASNVIDTTAPYELVSTMRASFWVIAPLLARFGEARVSMPGGCAIGTRPIDLMLMALERLGATVEIDGGYVVAKAKSGLRGGEIHFPKVTVGGTHVALMAAALANGSTLIENAAREPEVVDLADCLIKMGARISGAGTPRITIEGVSRLNGARHTVLPDRIETGTYAMAAAMVGGDVTLENTRADLLHSALDVLTTTGAEITSTADTIRIRRNGGGIAAVDVTTDPFPGFPTDLQAQFMAADDPRQGSVPHPRDHLREPLHALCRNWRASGPGSGSRAISPSSTGWSASRARPSWRPTCAPRSPSSSPASPPRARPASTGSIISIAASKRSKPSSAAAAPRSAASAPEPLLSGRRSSPPGQGHYSSTLPRLGPNPGMSQRQGDWIGLG